MPGCGDCRHCVDDPGSIERLLPGLGILSSAYGASRGDTALCRFHDMFLRPGPACPAFEARAGGDAGEPPVA
jgi:hypothetical protein